MDQPPKDLVFYMRPCYFGKILKHWNGNIAMEMLLPFFLKCLQRHNREMNVDDVAIGDGTIGLLMPDHLCFLRQKGILQTMLTKLKC